jgi:hypothetical protein
MSDNYKKYTLWQRVYAALCNRHPSVFFKEKTNV